MKRLVIARLRRLIRLTGQVHDQHARAAAEAGLAHEDLLLTLAETRRHLDDNSFAVTVFPSLMTNRVARLGRSLDILTEDLQRRVEAAAASKASVKGLESKLQREIATDAQERELKVMEDVVDRFVRQRKASLP